MTYVCNLPYTKSENCILVYAKECSSLENNSNLILSNVRGYTREVLDVGYTEVFLTHKLAKNDVVVVSKTMENISRLRNFTIDGEYNNKQLVNIHCMQILGRVNSDFPFNIELFYNKVLLEEVIIPGLIIDKKVYRVLSIGSHNFNDNWEQIPLEVKVNDLVVTTENSLTPISENITGVSNLFITEENNIVGCFDSEVIIDTVKNLSVCFKPFASRLLLIPHEDTMCGSLHLVKYDEEIDDISEMYNRDKFEVLCVGKDVNNIKKKDIINVNRDTLTQFSFGNKDYFVANGEDYIRGIYK